MDKISPVPSIATLVFFDKNLLFNLKHPSSARSKVLKFNNEITWHPLSDENKL